MGQWGRTEGCSSGRMQGESGAAWRIRGGRGRGRSGANAGPKNAGNKRTYRGAGEGVQL